MSYHKLIKPYQLLVHTFDACSKISKGRPWYIYLFASTRTQTLISLRWFSSPVIDKLKVLEIIPAYILVYLLVIYQLLKKVYRVLYKHLPGNSNSCWTYFPESRNQTIKILLTNIIYKRYLSNSILLEGEGTLSSACWTLIAYITSSAHMWPWLWTWAI